MFILIYVTHRNQKAAEKIANHLLKKRLIACANFFPIKSSYWWKGKIENGKEIVSLLKAKEENWHKIKSEIEKIHPCEPPHTKVLPVGKSAFGGVGHQLKSTKRSWSPFLPCFLM